ncbi:MAG: ABC transporter ATP-binding protein [Verrucomicrobiota bacterium]|nr:ABC transporter ATP-binding protein [Chthoniobacterales bacterium]MDQ3116605.1 ABC transporter ATP-binding protein [Verrucomicrobiota bacterium]
MISLQKVSRYYEAGERSVHALEEVSLNIGRHEFVAVVGPSGCGKSTLMHLIAGLDRPTAGEIMVDGISLTTAGDAQLTDFRRRQLGLVFQFFNLLPTMNALENVTLPLLLQGVSLAESEARARELLELVGLTNRSTHFVHQLSGGEQQRTAIARALVHRPSLLVADEPTGNLDTASAARVLDLLRQIANERLATLILVTHSAEVAAAASRLIELRDGKVVSDRLAATDAA